MLRIETRQRRWALVAISQLRKAAFLYTLGVVASVLGPRLCAQSAGGVFFANQYCAQVGQLDESCINGAGTAAAGSGGTVYISAGTYTISNPVTFYSGVTYVGAGQGVSILQEANGTNLARPFASQTGAAFLTIRDLTLDGNEANNTATGQLSLLEMNGTSNSTLMNLTIQNFFGFLGNGTAPCVGFLGASVDNLVQNNHVFNCGGLGRLSDAIYIGGTRSRVIGNLIDSAQDTGVVAEGAIDAVISDNVIRNTAQPIAVDGLVNPSTVEGVTISGNTIDGGTAANGAAIYVINVAGSQTHSITITGNTVSNTVDGHGIFVEDAALMTISGNVLNNISPTQPIWKSGIIVINSSDINVTGNTVAGAGGNGIDIQGSTRIVVASNLVSGNGVMHGDGIVIEDGSSFPITALAGGGGTCTATLSPPAYLTTGDMVTVAAAGGDPNCLGQHALLTVGADYLSASYAAAGASDSGGSGLLTRNSSQITLTGNQSSGSSQLYGLSITGGSTGVFASGNQLTGNISDDGIQNVSSGSVELGINQTSESGPAPIGSLDITEGGLILGNNVALQSETSSGQPVNLLRLTRYDTNNITRYLAGVDLGGFQWTNQEESQNWMDLLPTGLAIGNGARIPTSSELTIYLGQIVTTASSQDGLPASTAAASAHCLAQAVNAAAAQMTGTFVVVGSDRVVLNHPAVAGATFDIFCTADAAPPPS